MKRFGTIVLTIGMVLALFGCNNVQKNASVTFEDIAKANSADAVFKRHNNFYIEQKTQDDGSNKEIKAYSNIYGFEMLCKPDTTYYKTDYLRDDELGSHDIEYAIYIPEGVYWLGNKDGKETVTCQWYAMTADETKEKRIKSNVFPGMTDPVETSEEVNEKLVSEKDNGDGTLTLITNVSDITKLPDIGELPDDWNGASMEYQYVVDKDTLEVKELNSYILSGDQRIPFSFEKFTYDVTEPVDLGHVIDTVKNAEMKEPQDPKTISVIYDSGTEKEEVFKKTVDKSCMISPVIRDGYKYYNDPEGKVPFTGTNGKVDAVIYAVYEK